MAHRNIPVFIPHLGCPNHCVFCNQRSISGCTAFDESLVRGQIEETLSTISEKDETEIAFFGGSFTGIDRELMIRLLETAAAYVRAGRVRSIRLSTRPDYVDGGILEILSRYPVRTVELGLQSMDDAVLNACRRGHTAKQARDACRAVVGAGFELVGQMMIGLPAATPQSEVATAREIVSLGVSAARIYPTVVFADTPLAGMTAQGDYRPLTAEEAVTRSADVLDVFESHGIPCIRIGLCATEALTSPEQAIAGPIHPALGELVRTEWYYRRMLREITEKGLAGKEITLFVPSRFVSAAVGQHRHNIDRLLRETGTRVIKIVGTKSRAVSAEPADGQKPTSEEDASSVSEIS